MGIIQGPVGLEGVKQGSVGMKTGSIVIQGYKVLKCSTQLSRLTLGYAGFYRGYLR